MPAVSARIDPYDLVEVVLLLTNDLVLLYFDFFLRFMIFVLTYKKYFWAYLFSQKPKNSRAPNTNFVYCATCATSKKSALAQLLFAYTNAYRPKKASVPLCHRKLLLSKKINAPKYLLWWHTFALFLPYY